MTLRGIMQLALIAFVLWFVIEEPVQVGHVMHQLGAFLTTAANGFAAFLKGL